MTAPRETSSRRQRVIVYVVVAVAMVALLAAGLAVFRSAKSNREAEEKADRFIAALQRAGAVRTPSREQTINLLGDDGGAICAEPNRALAKAALFTVLANGAGGPGSRPVIADRKLLQGELLVIQTYCPDQLPRFQNLVGKLKSAGVTGG